MRAFPNSVSRSRLIVAIIVIFFALSVGLAWLSSKATGGKFIYPLDDTYIMMSIAKNFSQSGVWGVTRFEFTSTTSTPLYTALLSGCYRLTGVTEWWPLVLSLISATLLLLLASAWLRPLSEWLRGLGLLSVLALVPLYVLALTGLEHCLHACLSLCFLWLASTSLETGTSDWRILALSPLMVMVRFESLFLICICAVLFILRKRYRFGLGLLLGAAGALAIYSAISLAHGWAWLPNPILMKGHFANGRKLWDILLSLGLRSVLQLLAEPHVGFIFFALVTAFVATRKQAGIWDRRRIALLIAGLAILAHLQFARVGWVYRYEAYLIALGIVCLFAALPLIEFKIPSGISFSLVGGIMLAILAARSWNATKDIQRASFNIYEQQYQMARFVVLFYPQAAVAANDIGWITYASDIRLLDLTGLANWGVFKARRDGCYTTRIIDSEVGRVNPEIAIVYDAWFGDRKIAGWGGPALPPKWTRVGRWRISDNLILGDSTVSFYAVQSTGILKLQDSLVAFAPELPNSVTVLQN